MTATNAAYWSASFAGLAAVFWLWSAVMVIPYVGNILSGPRVDSPESKVIRQQSRLSAAAAACAAVAAALQGWSTYLSTLPSP